MKKKNNRSKKLTVPKGKFPPEGLRIVQCRPFAIAKVRWQPDPDNSTKLQATFTWEWIVQPQVVRSDYIDGDPLKALTTALNRIADQGNVDIVKLWRQRVFDDLANVPLRTERQGTMVGELP